MLTDDLTHTEKKMLNPLMNSRKRADSLFKLVDSSGAEDKRKKSIQSLVRFCTLSIDDL